MFHVLGFASAIAPDSYSRKDSAAGPCRRSLARAWGLHCPTRGARGPRKNWPATKQRRPALVHVGLEVTALPAASVSWVLGETAMVPAATFGMRAVIVPSAGSAGTRTTKLPRSRLRFWVATRVSNASHHLVVVASDALLDSESLEQNRSGAAASFPLAAGGHRTTTLRPQTHLACPKKTNIVLRMCLRRARVLFIFFLLFFGAVRFHCEEREAVFFWHSCAASSFKCLCVSSWRSKSVLKKSASVFAKRFRPHGHGLNVFLECLGVSQTVLDGVGVHRIGIYGILAILIVCKPRLCLLFACLSGGLHGLTGSIPFRPCCGLFRQCFLWAPARKMRFAASGPASCVGDALVGDLLWALCGRSCRSRVVPSFPSTAPPLHGSLPCVPGGAAVAHDH